MATRVASGLSGAGISPGAKSLGGLSGGGIQRPVSAAPLVFGAGAAGAGGVAGTFELTAWPGLRVWGAGSAVLQNEALTRGCWFRSGRCWDKAWKLILR